MKFRNLIGAKGCRHEHHHGVNRSSKYTDYFDGSPEVIRILRFRRGAVRRAANANCRAWRVVAVKTVGFRVIRARVAVLGAVGRDKETTRHSDSDHVVSEVETVFNA